VFFDPAGGSRIIAAAGEAFSIVSALNESGLVVGRSATASGGSAAYAWSQASGLRLLSEDDASFSASEAVLVTEEGIVAGRANTLAPSSPVIFQWNPATSAVSNNYPRFALQAMNRDGTMLGFADPGNVEEGRFATLAADGTLTLVEPALGRTSSAHHYIDDNGNIFANAGRTGVIQAAGLKTGAIAIVGGKALNVGLGIAPPGPVPSADSAFFTGYSPRGSAVGVDQPNGLGDRAAFTGFYWTAQQGAVAVDVGSSKTYPRGVNNVGVVVGEVTPLLDSTKFESQAFVWSRASGGFLLDALVTNLPVGGHLRRARAVADSGHIAAEMTDGRLVLLTPSAACMPAKPAGS
jgi:hypothetical protein